MGRTGCSSFPTPSSRWSTCGPSPTPTRRPDRWLARRPASSVLWSDERRSSEARGVRGAQRPRPVSPINSDYPAELKYTSEHEWARLEGDNVRVGITFYAQD